MAARRPRQHPGLLPPTARAWEVLTVDVLALVLGDLADLELAVGGLGGAVTAREIVDDETQDVVAGDVLEGGLDLGDVGDGVAAPSCQHRSSFFSCSSVSPTSPSLYGG